jgi:hypothetical protein
VEKWKAKRDFAQANDLFKLKRYNDALVLLTKLNREFPGNRRIMMARALCLAEIGRYHETLTACDEILAIEHYPRAVQLQNKMKALLAAEAPPRATAELSAYLDAAPPAAGTTAFGDERPAYAPLPESNGRDWWIPVLLALVLLLAAVGVGGAAYYLLTNQPSTGTELATAEPQAGVSETAGTSAEASEPPEIWVPDYSQYERYAPPGQRLPAAAGQQQDLPPGVLPPAPFPGAQPGVPQAEPFSGAVFPGQESTAEHAAAGDTADPAPGEAGEAPPGLLGLGIAILAGVFVVAVVLEFIVLFSTLMLLNKMPRPTLGENLLLIAGVSVAAVLVSRIPYVGWFASLFIIITALQLTLVDCLVLLLVNAVVMVAALFLAVAIIGVSFQAFF